MRYPWRRYWSRWDRNPSAPTSGFLHEIGGSAGWFNTSEYQTLGDLASVPCLVLVGEPGIGKSDAISQELNRLRDERCRAFIYDLKEYSTADEIGDAIFGDLASAEGVISVFLDSLDEGRTAIQNLLAPLQRILRERLANAAYRDRLRLRITCRSQDWPHSLGDELRNIFGEENVEFWHMCPLQRSDAAAGAAAEGLCPNTFIDQVADARAEPLAAKPVTFDLLVRIVKSDGRIPPRQADVYRNGLELLCLDPNKWRITEANAGFAGGLGHRHRLALARRIACLSIIGQRPFMYIDSNVYPAEPGCLSLEEICEPPASEHVNGREWNFSASDVKEVLGCGLFRGAGADKVTWAHLTYGEFLAADHLHSHEIGQIENILRSPGEERIAPAMRETAAWLASIHTSYGQKLIDENPDVLLRSDVALADDDTRLRLAKNYLELVNLRRIEADRDRKLFPRFGGPGIADALTPYLTPGRGNLEARHTAIEIAAACKCKEVEAILIAIAGDTNENVTLRRSALNRLKEIGITCKSDFVPLLTETNDELRVAAITLLWPGTISTAEMLSAIRPPSSNLIGMYSVFLRKDLVPSLTDDDLPVALEWMKSFIQSNPEPPKGTEELRFHDFVAICPKLCAAGAKNSENDCTFAALLDIADALLTNDNWRYYPTIHDRDYEIDWPNDATRRRFAYSLFRRNVGRQHTINDANRLFAALQPGDIYWLLNCLNCEHEVPVQDILAMACCENVDIFDEAQYEAIYRASLCHVALAPFRRAFEPFIDLDSLSGKYIREQHLRRQQPNGAEDARSKSVENVLAEIQHHLATIKLGNPISWWRFALLLSHNPEVDAASYESGLQTWWGWRQLSVADQAVVAGAAWHFICNEKLLLGGWWENPNSQSYSEMFGCLALAYFAEKYPERLHGLPKATWERWAPAIVAFPGNNQSTVEIGRRVAALCYAACPDAMTFRIRERLLLCAAAPNHAIWFDEILKGLWDPAIAQAITDTLAVPELSSLSFETGLKALVANNDLGAQDLVAKATVDSGDIDRRPIILALALRHDRGRRWEELWPTLVQNVSLCRSTLDWAVEDDFLSHMTVLTPRDWADLYLFLVATDPPIDLVPKWVPARAKPPFFAGSIINHLVALGTGDACQALEHIALARPDLDWVPNATLRCRENFRNRVWQAPLPKNLLRLLANNANRLVRTERDLMDVMTALLERYQRQLSLEDVWNTCPDHRPKDEAALSNHLIRYLRHELSGRALIANREVQIETYGSGTRAARVDILVEAIAPESPRDSIRVVIETKGCWNKDLMTSMKTQLVENYLSDKGVSCGIYFVAWFLCSKWSSRDRRRLALAKSWGLTAADARERFRMLAHDLSIEGRHVSAFVLDVGWPDQNAGGRQPRLQKKSVKRRAPNPRNRLGA